METVITILCDNNINIPGLIGEHGFSLLFQRNGAKYLFDTGPGMSLPLNLKALNMNLDGLNKIFISHGHYDHTGGLKWAVQQTGKTEVVAHRDVFTKHTALDVSDVNAKPYYIGCPYTQDELERLGAHFHFLDHTREVSPGVRFVTGIDVDSAKRPADDRLVLPHGEKFVPDPIKDDSSILIDTDSGPVLVLGCAHAGVLNILDHVRLKMGVEKLHAILGGTHLMFFSPEYLHRIIDKFEESAIDLIAVSHCTGMIPAIELAKHFDDRFRVASAGSVFNF